MDSFRSNTAVRTDSALMPKKLGGESIVHGEGQKLKEFDKETEVNKELLGISLFVQHICTATWMKYQEDHTSG
jgi:hypothetical protein